MIDPILTPLQYAAILIAAQADPKTFATHDSYGNWRTSKEDAISNWSISLAKKILEKTKTPNNND